MEPKQWFLRSAQNFLWDLFSALLILCILKIGSRHACDPENIETLGGSHAISFCMELAVNRFITGHTKDCHKRKKLCQSKLGIISQLRIS